MTITERNKKLKYFITCMKCEVSGKCCDENCPTQYDAGNMGEIIENLEAISKALEQELKKSNNAEWIKAIEDIKAEIDEESTKSFKYPNWERAKALEWALSVIDKYKESEDKE